MTRIGIVGGQGGSINAHGGVFAALLSQRDREAWAEAGLPEVDAAPIEGTTIAAIHDSDPDLARLLASTLPGAEVVRDPQDMVGRVDGVLIIDDTTQRHQKQAAAFLRAGVPTFVDKPLARETGEAAHIIAVAEAVGTPLMSGSALRYARELIEAREQIDAIGPIRTAVAVGPGELIFYGIHACEMFHSVLGPGIESVHNLGEPGSAFVKVSYGDGRTVLLAVSEHIAYTFELTLYGARGSLHIVVSDHIAFYRNMLEAAVRMFRTGEQPIPSSSMLEVIKTLHGAERSMELGHAVRLADM